MTGSSDVQVWGKVRGASAGERETRLKRGYHEMRHPLAVVHIHELAVGFLLGSARRTRRHCTGLQTRFLRTFTARDCERTPPPFGNRRRVFSLRPRTKRVVERGRTLWGR